MNDELVRWKSLYAEMAEATSSSRSMGLREAFFAVDRDAFIPEGPYLVAVNGTYIKYDIRDVRVVHQNVAVAIDSSRKINCGEPFLHARWLGWVRPRASEVVTHIGTGTGYYTALLSLLVGNAGRINAIEVDPRLSEITATNLASFQNVITINANGFHSAIPHSDVVYVNAAFESLPAGWLLALRDGGRLIFPWKCGASVSRVLLIRRNGSQYEARTLYTVRFIDGVIERDGHRPIYSAGPRSSDSVRSAWISDVRLPDATAVAIFPSAWLSSDDAS